MATPFGFRCFRAALLGCTALVAPCGATSLLAQPLPAPNARPQLDRVAAGGITIRHSGLRHGSWPSR
jgi:hypothetical protein